MTNQLHGLGTALITPFSDDFMVDYPALYRMLDKQLRSNVDFLVILGTTGEAATVSPKEKSILREYIVKKVNGRLPLVLGFGGNATQLLTRELKAISKELSTNFSALLSVCPYYNKPSQEGLYRHFCSLAEASPIPLILYNVPGRTGVNMLPEMVVRIYESCPEKIMGIKEASGDIKQIKKLIAMAEGRFAIYGGDDAIACETMKAGADGLISVASNAFAADFHKIVHEQDTKLQKKYAPLINLLFADGNPAGIKTVLYEQGLISNRLRLPLVPTSLEVHQSIIKEMAMLEDE